MDVLLHTGSPKCRVLHLLECPVCGEEFESTEGVYVPSITLGDRLKVCTKHVAQEFTAEEEVKIQDSFNRTIHHKRGYIMRGDTVIKKSSSLLKHNPKLK